MSYQKNGQKTTTLQEDEEKDLIKISQFFEEIQHYPIHSSKIQGLPHEEAKVLNASTQQPQDGQG